MSCFHCLIRVIIPFLVHLFFLSIVLGIHTLVLSCTVMIKWHMIVLWFGRADSALLLGVYNRSFLIVVNRKVGVDLRHALTAIIFRLLFTCHLHLDEGGLHAFLVGLLAGKLINLCVFLSWKMYLLRPEMPFSQLDRAQTTFAALSHFQCAQFNFFPLTIHKSARAV